MDIADRYTWQALMPDSRVITKGGDIAGCVKFSLIPAEGTGLPAHDLVGVEILRRFGTCYKHVFSGQDKDYTQCVVCKGFRFYVRCSDGVVLITPEDYELNL